SVTLVAASGALVWALLSRCPAAGGPVAAAPAAAPSLTASAPSSAEGAVAPAPARLAGDDVDERAAGARPAERAAAPTPELGPARAGGGAGAAGASLVLASDADRRGYDRAVRDLEGVLRRGRGRLQPETVRALEQSLATIDSAIAEARRALARDPGSPYLNAHLTDTLRRKVELLQQVGTLVGET
ncbi:MAG: hypothetical protein IRZ00_12510, partial [Gemmatimonadetes bacterium]|nr:hypothetical protein [Gemmatimonadota bacterium]